ncbi:hypothetical protein MAP00_002869 [Monascus purpureus]|nr:hypothetical protein MAP00_002869 [Monascus purpureus]
MSPSMPSISISMLALGLIPFITGALADLSSCPSDTPFSCQGSSSRLKARASDSCCVNSPGGMLLQTQFWDTDPSTGPEDSWTIHGLWPDNCDGTYESSCDSSRAYKNITDILQAQDRTQLLSYMDTYWVDINGDNEQFWSHEWSKHGTCINTIEPSCYTDYTPQEEVGDFFQKVVDLFKGLDTYKALADAGIMPGSDEYDLSDLEDALAKIHDGKKPQLSCESGELNQVYYYFVVQGNAIDGTYKAVDSVQSSNCPSSGITYAAKSGSDGYSRR